VIHNSNASLLADEERTLILECFSFAGSQSKSEQRLRLALTAWRTPSRRENPTALAKSHGARLRRFWPDSLYQQSLAYRAQRKPKQHIGLPPGQQNVLQHVLPLQSALETHLFFPAASALFVSPKQASAMPARPTPNFFSAARRVTAWARLLVSSSNGLFILFLSS